MPRTRSGCGNCKRRKRKCDEARPGCQSCAQRGLVCDGYVQPLRWNHGIASRGRFMGALAPTTDATGTEAAKLAGNADRPSSLPTAATNYSPGGTYEQSPTDSSNASTSSPVNPSTVSSPGSQDDATARLFDQCPFTILTTSTVLTGGLLRLYATEAQCWIQPFFRRLSEQSKAFIHVCAAIQGYFNDHQAGLSVSSLEYVDHALQMFRAELASLGKPMHLATTVAGLLICTLLSLQGRPWTVQLYLVADLVGLPRTVPRLDPETADGGERLHILEVMAIMDMPSFMFGRANPSMHIWARLREAQNSWAAGKAGGVEVVSGLPRSMLDIFAAIPEGDGEYAEKMFFGWPGETGNYVQCQLWECCRLAGVLEIRRRRRYRRHRDQISSAAHATSPSAHLTPADAENPSTEVIMCRLLAAMDALIVAVNLPRNKHLLVQNGMIYPLVVACLEVAQLQAHPEWKVTLCEIRDDFIRKDHVSLTGVTFGLIDEVWAEGSGYLDPNELARQRDIELALF